MTTPGEAHGPKSDQVEPSELWEVHWQVFGGTVNVEGPYDSFSQAIRQEDLILARHFGSLALIGVVQVSDNGDDVSPLSPSQASRSKQ